MVTKALKNIKGLHKLFTHIQHQRSCEDFSLGDRKRFSCCSVNLGILGGNDFLFSFLLQSLMWAVLADLELCA